MLINYKCKCLLKNEQFFSWNFFESIFYIKIVLKKIFLFCLKKVCKNMQNFFWNFFLKLKVYIKIDLTNFPIHKMTKFFLEFFREFK